MERGWINRAVRAAFIGGTTPAGRRLKGSDLDGLFLANETCPGGYVGIDHDLSAHCGRLPFRRGLICING